MTPVLTIAGTELRRFLRDRSNLFFTFVFPLVLILLIGSQFGGQGSDSSVVLAGPPSALHDDLTRAMADADIDVSTAGAGAARDEVARGDADAAVLVPAGVAEAYRSGSAADVELVVGNQGSSTLAAQRVEAAVRALALEQAQRDQLVAAGVPEADVEALLAEAGRQVEPVALEIVDLDEVAQEFEGVGGFEVGASQMVLLFVFLTSLTGAIPLIQARTLRIVPRALAAPVTTRQVVAGQALGRFAIAGVQGAYIVVGTAVLFGVDWGSLPLTLLVLAAFCAVAAAAAMVVGAAIDNENAAVGIGVGAGLVIAGIGGSMLPLELFSDTMRTVARATPHAWAYEAFADITRRDGGLADIWPSLAVLVAMAVVLGLLGGSLLRRSLARAI